MAAIDSYLRAILVRAEHEARADGSATVEARHLLLAVAGEPEADTRRILDSVGLDEQTIRAALEREFEHSLNAVGVSGTSSYDLPPPSRLPAHPGMGTSAKLALERGFASVSRKKDLRPAHVLLGILSAPVGTVPRALTLAGVDRDDLTARVRRTLTTEPS
jgi:ATP-dependent Clp protease ATP-binding subunit ClpA